MPLRYDRTGQRKVLDPLKGMVPDLILKSVFDCRTRHCRQASLKCSG
jgi:hypothetical protein